MHKEVDEDESQQEDRAGCEESEFAMIETKSERVSEQQR